MVESVDRGLRLAERPCDLSRPQASQVPQDQHLALVPRQSSERVSQRARAVGGDLFVGLFGSPDLAYRYQPP